MIKVLVVDDDMDLLEMVSMMLRANAMEVCELSDSTKFFHAIETFTPDFILMDIFLGSDDGRELCSKVKKHAQFSTIPLLLYSAGHVSQESIRESKANGFLQKPFEMPVLLRNIREQVAARSA